LTLLWQSVTLFLHPLLLFKHLIKKENIKKTGFAPIHAQAAPPLACRTFSNSNTQGYPQE